MVSKLQEVRSVLLIATMLILFVKESAVAQEKKANIQTRSFIMPNGLSSQKYIPGKLIVKYRNLNNSVNSKVLFSSLSRRCSGVNSLDKVFKDAPHSLMNIYQVDYVPTRKLEDIINEILQDENVEYCEPNYTHRMFYTPNDPLTGITDYFAQIDAFKAWDITRISNSVVIGIVDSGFETTHEDLAASIEINHHDPVNGLDDDNDGFVDNYWGWDFVGADYLNPKEDNDPNISSETAEHGLHVSGLAGAISDNSKGISSVGFNARLLLVKCSADNNGTHIYRGYEGIRYAVDHGAKIINCSWGTEVYSAFGKDMIDYANSKGCLVVAAAGNDNNLSVQYPAAYPGVLAVANVDKNDVKSPTSNFGRYIGISAPGVNVLSTTYKNGYGIKSGTSMAAPIVSSAAALLKSHFPHLSMPQIAETLKSTTDELDSKNPNYKGMLGSGKLNVYKALTTHLPSIRLQQISIENEETLSGGQTVSFYLTIKNLLRETNNLKIELTSTNPYATILNKQVIVNSIATLEEQRIGPFQIELKSDIPFNSLIEFMVNYNNSSDYNFSEYFSKTVNYDYINYQFNQINTTATSNGRIGYRNENAELGNGFVYKMENFLYECSLIMGFSKDQISNNSSNSRTTADNDFVPIKRIRQVVKSDSIFKTETEFNDSGNPKPLNVTVKQSHTAYKYSPHDKYIIVECQVKNNNGFSLNNFYIGLFSDWDIDQNSNDITQFDRKRRLGYVSAKDNPTICAGAKLLDNIYPINYFPLKNSISGNPLQDERLSRAEKFEIISSGIKTLTADNVQSTINDVSFALSYGPVSIKAKDSATFSFALLIDDSILNLESAADGVQARYLKDISKTVEDKAYMKPIYPNPVINMSRIEFYIPKSGNVDISLYTILGQKIRNLVSRNFESGSHIIELESSDLPGGFYLYEMKYGSYKQSYKMIVIK